MTNNKLVSVVIPTWNRREMVVRCIESVLRSGYENIEVLVGEDPSKNEAEPEIRRKYGKDRKVKYLKNKKMALVAATVNKLLRLSKGEYIFLLNDDNVIDKRCVEELVSSLKRHKEVGIVGPLAFYYSHPKIIMHAGTVRSGFMRAFTSPHANEKWHGQIREGDVVDDFGNAFMFRREAMLKAGMWDLLVPTQGEDGDFEARVKKAGYGVIINPRAKTYHDIPYLPVSNTVSLFFLRVDQVRLYNAMHSKILYEYRYESTINKLTFTLSLPVYYSYYVYAIMKTPNYHTLEDKLHLFALLNTGILKGFCDALFARNMIEYIKR